MQSSVPSHVPTSREEVGGRISEKMTWSDVFDGVISCLILRDYTGFQYDERRWVKTFVLLMDEIRLLFGNHVESIECFLVADPVYGTSEKFSQEFRMAIQIGLFSLSWPGGDMIYFHDKELAEIRLRRLPGNPELYRQLTRRFLNHFESTASL